MIRSIVLLLTLVAASFVFAVAYGNGVMYLGFPELPNILRVFFDPPPCGERAYDLIYDNAFLYSLVAASAVFAITTVKRRQE